MSEQLCPSLAEQAYHRHLDEILSVPKARQLQVNLDVNRVVALGLEVFDRLNLLRDEIQARLADFDIGNLDRLRGYALALSHANARCLRRGRLSRENQALLSDVSEARVLFLSDATALTKRSLIEPAVLARYSGVRSQLQTLEDLSQLIELLRTRWPTIEGKTAITPDELDRAEHLVRQVRQTVRLDERQPEARASRQRIRAQAFTLFAGAYEELRRAACYLRWYEDLGKGLVPPLRGTRAFFEPSRQEAPQPSRISSIWLTSQRLVSVSANP